MINSLFIFLLLCFWKPVSLPVSQNSNSKHLTNVISSSQWEVLWFQFQTWPSWGFSLCMCRWIHNPAANRWYLPTSWAPLRKEIWNVVQVEHYTDKNLQASTCDWLQGTNFASKASGGNEGRGGCLLPVALLSKFESMLSDFPVFFAVGWPLLGKVQPSTINSLQPMWSFPLQEVAEAWVSRAVT